MGSSLENVILPHIKASIVGNGCLVWQHLKVPPDLLVVELAPQQLVVWSV